MAVAIFVYTINLKSDRPLAGRSFSFVSFLGLTNIVRRVKFNGGKKSIGLFLNFEKIKKKKREEEKKVRNKMLILVMALVVITFVVGILAGRNFYRPSETVAISPPPSLASPTAQTQPAEVNLGDGVGTV